MLLLAAVAACGRAPQPSGSDASANPDACLPQVDEGWVRLTPGAMAMDAGFGRIANPCGTPVRITGADSPAYADVSLHETTLENGISRMRAVPALELPARGEVRLQPGGLHLMLMQRQGALVPGATVEIGFRLDDGREVRGAYEVRAAQP